MLNLYSNCQGALVTERSRSGLFAAISLEFVAIASRLSSLISVLTKTGLGKNLLLVELFHPSFSAVDASEKGWDG